jgi:peptidoglycan/LPS O-acetylase OafA/YrhL
VHYLPGLDGLRTLSIALVLLSHVQGTGAPARPAWWWHVGDTGNLGVRIFFVISGFLITHLLLREEHKRQRISIPHFYIRRAFRILPALWGMLLVMLVARSAGVVSFPTLQLVQGAFFTANYPLAHGTRWLLGHLWSLSVEEQFYLLWPALLAFAPKSWRVRVLVIAVAAAPLLRLAELLLAAHHGMPVTDSPPNGFFSSMDALAMGCLLAVFRTGGTVPAWYQRLTARWWVAGLPVLLILLNGLTMNPWIFLVGVLPAMNLTAAVLIDVASRGLLTGWQRLLDLSPVRWVGRLSYSLYLWQQPFLDRESHEWFARYPINLVGACLAAALSYYLIERPALSRRPV